MVLTNYSHNLVQFAITLLGTDYLFIFAQVVMLLINYLHNLVRAAIALYSEPLGNMTGYRRQGPITQQ